MQKARDIEKKAWDDFRKWGKQWKKDHPEDEDLDLYMLALMYSDGDTSKRDGAKASPCAGR